MSFTYAIGDLHGRADCLDLCLAKIEEDRKARGDDTGANTTIVFLGDYIDRGSKSSNIVERLMQGAQDDSKWVTLLGNHELMAIMAHADPEQYWLWWVDNGGATTLMNYEPAAELPAWAKVSQKISTIYKPLTAREMDISHLQWFNLLPDRYQDKHRLFVHAGIKKDLPLPLQSQQIVLWTRHGRDVETPITGSSNLYIVHGHTPFPDGPVVLQTRCNLDTGSYRTGVQVIAVFDDEIAGPPIDMLTVRAGYALA